jgi:hypothetical protein
MDIDVHSNESVFTWVGSENPSREGTKRHERYEIMRQMSGSTLGALSKRLISVFGGSFRPRQVKRAFDPGIIR